MSTRSIIARATGEGTFQGVYHHWDGYPTGLGKYLTEILTGQFASDLPLMLHALIDEHPAGWSTILHKDFTLSPGYTWEKATHPSCEGPSDAEYRSAMEAYRAMPDVRRPQCYCHGERSEEAQVISERDDCGAEWAYVFDEDERVMHVCHRERHPDSCEFFTFSKAFATRARDADSVEDIPHAQVFPQRFAGSSTTRATGLKS